MFRQRAGVVTAVAAAFIVAIGGWAVSAGDDGSKVYTACVKKSSGELRLINPASKDPERSTCTRRERRITWNERGPVGPAGEVGPVGPSGLSALGGQHCPEGEALVGFTADGSLSCAPIEGLGDPDDPDVGPDDDQDGVPNTEDPCPAIPAVVRDGVTYHCPATTYDVLTGTTVVGTRLYLPDVKVVAVEGSVVTLGHVVGDPAYQGEDFSRIDIDFTGFEVPTVGSRVTAYGVVATDPDGQPTLDLEAVDLVMAG